ncbi:unnamed protein product [Diplocarpon coronariae]|nr:hypothetical protein JHW43_001581 [Diplocarpon mali]
MEYTHLRPSLPTRTSRLNPAPLQMKLTALQQNFSLPTLLLIGASFQCFLFMLPIPAIYTVSPAFFLLLVRTIETLLITYHYIPNPYLKNALMKKSTAQPMDLKGNFDGPGKQKVAVMMLGAKSNHPLGIFEPKFGKVGGFLRKMTQALNGGADQENGFLGQSAVTRRDANGATEQIFISYWRSLADIHAFAYSPTHLEAWRWWNSNIKDLDHVGIMHEVYEADAGMWESVYVNFQPTLLGNTTYLKREGALVGGEVAEEWVSPLLDANRGKLRTSNGRRGLGDRKEDVEMFYGNGKEGKL